MEYLIRHREQEGSVDVFILDDMIKGCSVESQGVDGEVAGIFTSGNSEGEFVKANYYISCSLADIGLPDNDTIEKFGGSLDPFFFFDAIIFFPLLFFLFFFVNS